MEADCRESLKISESCQEIYGQILLRFENFYANDKSSVKILTVSSSHYPLPKLDLTIHFRVVHWNGKRWHLEVL